MPMQVRLSIHVLTRWARIPGFSNVHRNPPLCPKPTRLGRGSPVYSILTTAHSEIFQQTYSPIAHSREVQLSPTRRRGTPPGSERSPLNQKRIRRCCSSGYRSYGTGATGQRSFTVFGDESASIRTSKPALLPESASYLYHPLCSSVSILSSSVCLSLQFFLFRNSANSEGFYATGLWYWGWSTVYERYRSLWKI
ncbi:hypothetical protein BDW59DRAFT_30311 [Aspergillus cavernicola]|uniref:Uncharacterized protein n=1 Tax=Aspergillus cavernicola TaxID=176166 RepID=A0ABR4HDT9_9EURO